MSDKDFELQSLIHQVMQARKLERDYLSLEDQIRCLKLRQGQNNKDEEIEREQFKVNNQLVTVQADALQQELETLKR